MCIRDSNTEMTYTPSDAIAEIYPVELPNLFQGSQLLVVGRYNTPQTVDMSFSGIAFGQEVEYLYDLALSDSMNTKLVFLPKIWAKQKIEQLTLDFYLAGGSYSTEGMALEDEITEISLCYGVASIFTSFQNAGENPDTSFDPNTGGYVFDSSIGAVVGVETIDRAQQNTNETSKALVQVAPNPFQDKVQLMIALLESGHSTIVISIYDELGKLVFSQDLDTNGLIELIWEWNGTDLSGKTVLAGSYPFTISSEKEILTSGQLVKM